MSQQEWHVDITGMSVSEAAAAIAELMNEATAQGVARMVKDGYALDQIEIVRPTVSYEDGRLRVRGSITGSKPSTTPGAGSAGDEQRGAERQGGEGE